MLGCHFLLNEDLIFSWSLNVSSPHGLSVVSVVSEGLRDLLFTFAKLSDGSTKRITFYLWSWYIVMLTKLDIMHPSLMKLIKVSKSFTTQKAMCGIWKQIRKQNYIFYFRNEYLLKKLKNGTYIFDFFGTIPKVYILTLYAISNTDFEKKFFLLFFKVAVIRWILLLDF